MEPDGANLEFLRLAMPPKPAGYWRFGELMLPQQRRPRWLTRFLMRHLAEWRWVDTAL